MRVFRFLGKEGGKGWEKGEGGFVKRIMYNTHFRGFAIRMFVFKVKSSWMGYWDVGTEGRESKMGLDCLVCLCAEKKVVV